jgi:phosphate transport system substrate-binding protein
MPTIYKCPNLGNCHKADSKEQITLPEGADPLCPECKSRLIPDRSPAVIKIPEDKKNIAIIAGLLVLIVAGVWLFFMKPRDGQNPGPSPDTKPFAGQTILRFQGSNTIGGKLLPALAEQFLKQEGYSDVQKVSVNEDEYYVEGEKNGVKGRIEIAAHGSKTAFEGLRERNCDIGMASRAIKDAEWSALKPVVGDLRSNASEFVLGLDGIAVIVHPSNTIGSLSISQLAGIFSGAITNWSELGGQSGEIKVYVRDEKSGTRDFFNEAVLKKYGKTITSTATAIEDSKELSAKVAGDPNAIGFIGLNYIGSNKALALSDVGVEARKPSQFTVKTEDYLLSRRLFLYAPETNKKPMVAKFLDFATGTAGQQIVAAIGLVNLDPTPQQSGPSSQAPVNDPRNTSTEWRNLTNGAIEIATRFRFRTNSEELDTRANRDIGRIVGLLSQPKYKEKRVVLIGFSDAAGSKRYNENLSQKRANVVAKALREEGVECAEVTGVGAEAFVAPNDTPENMEKNRRVEVWVK